MTDKLTPTPRTDAVVAQTMNSYSKSPTLRTGVWVDTDFARQLERELAALRGKVVEECAKVAEEFDHQSNPRRSGVKFGIAAAIRSLSSN